jgi:hypothetical protein
MKESQELASWQAVLAREEVAMRSLWLHISNTIVS